MKGEALGGFWTEEKYDLTCFLKNQSGFHVEKRLQECKGRSMETSLEEAVTVQARDDSTGTRAVVTDVERSRLAGT